MAFMDINEAVNNRRSIRRYVTDAIPQADIEKIILAGMQAPSAKNRQPWRFVAVEGNAKKGMIRAVETGIAREKTEPRLPQSAPYLASAGHTLSVMEQAPVTVFILNPLGQMIQHPSNWEARFYEMANMQSIGACIQNMLLTATGLGYGSLWNCDIFFAYEELAGWLRTTDQIAAAVSFGLPAESPNARPRYKIEDRLNWKND